MLGKSYIAPQYTTDWTVTADTGWIILVASNEDKIFRSISNFNLEGQRAWISLRTEEHAKNT